MKRIVVMIEGGLLSNYFRVKNAGEFKNFFKTVRG